MVRMGVEPMTLAFTAKPYSLLVPRSNQLS